MGTPFVIPRSLLCSNLVRFMFTSGMNVSQITTKMGALTTSAVATQTPNLFTTIVDQTAGHSHILLTTDGNVSRAYKGGQHLFWQHRKRERESARAHVCVVCERRECMFVLVTSFSPMFSSILHKSRCFGG